jgi:hypothetical protein
VKRRAARNHSPLKWPAPRCTLLLLLLLLRSKTPIISANQSRGHVCALFYLGARTPTTFLFSATICVPGLLGASSKATCGHPSPAPHQTTYSSHCIHTAVPPTPEMQQLNHAWVEDGVETPTEESTVIPNSAPSTTAASALPQAPFSLETEVHLLGDKSAVVVRTAPASHLQRTRALPRIGDLVAAPVCLTLCQYFEESGACNRGHKCRFAHHAGPPSDQAPERHAPAKPAPRGGAAPKNRNPPPPTHPRQHQAAPGQQQQQHLFQHHGLLGAQPLAAAPPVPAPATAPWRHGQQRPVPVPPKNDSPATPPPVYPPASATPAPVYVLHQSPGVAGDGYYFPVAQPPAYYFYQQHAMPMYAAPAYPPPSVSTAAAAAAAPPTLAPMPAAGGYSWYPFAPQQPPPSQPQQQQQQRPGTW